MTPVEWGLAALVGAAALVGVLRGFVRGVVDLLALSLGAAVAVYTLPWIDERLVGYGVSNRLVLLLIAAGIISLVAAASGLVLRVATAPLGLARAIPPFGWLDRLAGIVPGLVKGSLWAVIAVAAILVQLPATTLGDEIRSSELGDRLAQAGSRGFKAATSWTGQDLQSIAAREVGPGQTWTGTDQMPSGALRPDSAVEDAAWALIEAARDREGLPSLRSDRNLVAVAREHAGDARSAENYRLSETVTDVSDRLATHGRNCLAVGAVLATGSSAVELVESLLASKPHQDVLLSNTYVYAGIGVLSGATGEAILVGVFVF